MTVTDLLMLASVVLGQFLLPSLVGAGLLYLCLRTQLTFLQSWKAYLAAVRTGLMVIVVVNLLMPTRQVAFAYVVTLQAALTCLTHFVVILVLLRRFSRQAVLAEGCAVLLTNLIATTVMLSASAV